MSDIVPRRKSARQARIRKSSVYVEDDTDDDVDLLDLHQYAESSRQSSKRARSTTATQNYDLRAASSVATGGRSAVNTTSLPKQTGHGSSTRIRTRKVETRSKRLNTTKPVHRSKTFEPGYIRRLNIPIEPLVPVVPSDGVQPPWHTLPYQILFEIFSYAYESSVGNSWIIKVASQTCRAFKEAALSAFYRCPRFTSTRQLEGFKQAMEFPGICINYTVKVKQLHMNVDIFVKRAQDHQSIVAALIPLLPQLRSIKLMTLQDGPPYRRHHVPRWNYPSDLFDAVQIHQPRLLDWRWNFLLCKHSANSIDFMQRCHNFKSFQTLKHLEISDYPHFESGVEGTFLEDQIAEAISLLPALESLEFETCDIANSRLVPRLPSALRRLRFANCEVLNSEMLTLYLIDKGTMLEDLILDHNISLNLDFLTVLESSCPNLRKIAVDLKYYSQLHVSNHAGPRFSKLISPTNPLPGWSASLEVIELQNMSIREMDQARHLFESLINAGEKLSSLRRLIIQAHISMSWRERASFGEKWLQRLTTCFRRKSQDPDHRLASSKTFRNSINSFRPNNTHNYQEVRGGFGPRASPSSSERVESDASHTVIGTRRSKRITNSELAKAGKATEIELPPPNSPSASSMETPIVQGMCDYVDIVIDNQRPREEQRSMVDFLDQARESDDEDWHEGAEWEGDEQDAW